MEAATKLAESGISISRSTQRLRNLELTDPQIKAVAEKEDASSLLPLMAPFSGTVVERSVALGEVVDISRLLFAIADTTEMWAMLDVYEADIPKLKQGQPVVLEVEGLRGERHGGRISWISAHEDSQGPG